MGCFPPFSIIVRLVTDRLSPYPWPKRDLGSRHFAMKENLRSAVIKFLAKPNTEWYGAGIHKLILRYNKCFDEQGDYVEK